MNFTITSFSVVGVQPFSVMYIKVIIILILGQQELMFRSKIRKEGMEVCRVWGEVTKA